MHLVYKVGFLLGRLFKKSTVSSQTSSIQILEVNSLNESKGGSMDVNQLQDKAKKIMIERKWDILLIDAYLTTKNFVAWSERENFYGRFNVGITNIKGIKRSIDVSYIKDDTEFICGEIKGIKFQLGGVTHHSTMPDGDAFITTNLSLFIDEKCVLAVRYTMDRDKAYSYDDYSILSVEEFHKNDSIEPLLIAIRDGKNEQESKSKELERIDNEKKYEGKFSF